MIWLQELRLQIRTAETNTRSCQKVSSNIFSFAFVLIASLIVCFSLDAHAYSYTLHSPDTSKTYPFKVIVEITPDIVEKNWGCKIVDIDSNTLSRQLVTVSAEAADVHVKVTAVYTGNIEGHITSFNSPPAPIGLTNSWVAGSEPFSYSLTIPLEDIPDNALWLVSGLSYTQKVLVGHTEDGDPIYDWDSEDNSIRGTLLLSQHLKISASMNHSTQRLEAVVFEPTGMDAQCNEVGNLTNSTILIEDAGAYSISFDKEYEDEKIYNYFISAPLTSDFGTDGYLRDFVSIRAEKDGVVGKLMYYTALEYATAVEITGTTFLLSRENVIMDPRPVVVGEVLLPGDTIQIMSGTFHIKFCNGESAVISAGIGSTRILLGSDGIASKRSTMSVMLDNLAYDIKNDPRKYARIAIYKGIGYGTGTLFSGANWLFKTVVSEATKYGLKHLTGAHYRSATSAEDISTVPQQFYTVISLFPDGKIMFNPIHGQAQLNFGSSQAILAEGSRTMGDMTSADPQITSFGSEGYSLEQVYGLSAHWIGDGNEIQTRTPSLSLAIDPWPYTHDSPVNPNYLEIRLNGQLVPDASFDSSGLVLNNIFVTSTEAFLAGNNTLEAYLTEKNRPFRHLITGNLIVTDDAFATPPSEVSAYSSTTQSTIVRWQMQDYPDIKGYNIERGLSESGPFFQLNQNPYPQMVWFDDWTGESPTEPYWYRVQVVYQNSLTSSWSSPVQQEDAQRHSTLNRFETSGNVQVQSTPQGLQLLFNDNWPRTVFWKIERGITSSGPWQDLLYDQYLAQSGYQDQDVIIGKDYWYRLSIKDILDDTSTAVIVGPSSWDGRPIPPTGLTCFVKDGTAMLRWNTMKTENIVGFRVYRNSGSGFQLVASLPAATTIYNDNVPKTGNYLWLIKSISNDGLESLEGAQTPAYKWISTKASGTITLGNPTVKVENGEQVVTLPVFRTKGTSGAILATVAMNLQSDSGQETVSKYAGTILLDDGQSFTSLTTIIDDGYQLNDWNTFTLYNIFGSNIGSTSSAVPWLMYLLALAKTTAGS